MSRSISDIRVVGTSLLVSVSDVVLNLIVATITGSTVMLSQSMQGLSDLITGGILYQGTRRSKRQATETYQFGFGREVFFWVLVAGIVMFLGTGGLSVYFGYHQLMTPEPITNVWLAMGMLIFGLVTNAYSFSLSFRRLKRLDASQRWWQLLATSSLAETKATFIIDFLGTCAAILGLGSLALFVATGNVQFDGIGSVAIGVTMMVTAALLIHDMRGLLVGRAVSRQVSERIIGSAQSVPGILSVLDLRTMYIGSGKILVILEVHVADGLVTDQIEEVTDNVKRVVADNIPQAHHIQVEVETPDPTAPHGSARHLPR